ASAEAQPLGRLCLSVPAERFDWLRRQHHLPPRASRLGLGDAQPRPGCLHRAADVDRPAFEIDVRPSQAEQLALAHAGRERDHVERLKPSAFGGGEQRRASSGESVRISKRSMRGGSTKSATFRCTRFQRTACDSPLWMTACRWWTVVGESPALSLSEYRLCRWTGAKR